MQRTQRVRQARRTSPISWMALETSEPIAGGTTLAPPPPASGCWAAGLSACAFAVLAALAEQSASSAAVARAARSRRLAGRTPSTRPQSSSFTLRRPVLETTCRTTPSAPLCSGCEFRSATVTLQPRGNATSGPSAAASAAAIARVPCDGAAPRLNHWAKKLFVNQHLIRLMRSEFSIAIFVNIWNDSTVSQPCTLVFW